MVYMFPGSYRAFHPPAGRQVRFHKLQHPINMGGPEIEEFLTDLAVRRHVSASTQNQALCAIVFMYKHVLNRDPGQFNAVRAKRPQRLPVVLSRREVREILPGIEGKHPKAAWSLGWQFVFASHKLSQDPRTGQTGRHYVHPPSFQRAIKQAIRAAGVVKRVTSHAGAIACEC